MMTRKKFGCVTFALALSGMTAVSAQTPAEIEAALKAAHSKYQGLNDEGIRMILEDKVDALVADMPACALAVLRYPGANLSTPSAPFTVEPIGIAVRSNELSLQSLLENYVEAYKESGLIEMLRVQWLESGNWISQLP